MTAANRLSKYPLQLMKWLNNLLLWLLAACLAWHTMGQSNQECKETLESNVWGSCRKAWFNIFVKQNKHFWFQSHIWFWGLLYLQNKFQQTNVNEINHVNDNHIKFEVSLHFLGIWPTLCHGQFLAGKAATVAYCRSFYSGKCPDYWLVQTKLLEIDSRENDAYLLSLLALIVGKVQ